MKNLNIKISIAAITLMSIISSANAINIQEGPIDLPEPGTFGLFAGATVAAIILARIIKK